jgi:hypothetical protein
MMRLGIALVLAVAAFALSARAQNRLANPEFDDVLQIDGWHETGASGSPTTSSTVPRRAPCTC